MDRRSLSCEIEKWKFPQNDASEYQLLMYWWFQCIDLSNRLLRDRETVWHYSRKEIRLMRGFAVTDFFGLFFLVPKLDAREFESTNVREIALPQTRGRVFDAFWTSFPLLWNCFPWLYFSSRNSEEGHVWLLWYVYRNQVSIRVRVR